VLHLFAVSDALASMTTSFSRFILLRHVPLFQLYLSAAAVQESPLQFFDT
jgi:hypothetical protein